MEKVNLAEKLSQFSDYYNPPIAGELNGQQVKLVNSRESLSGIIMIRRMNCFM